MEPPQKPDDNRPQNMKKRKSMNTLKSQGSSAKLRTTEPEILRMPTLPIAPVTNSFRNLGLTATAGPSHSKGPLASSEPRPGTNPQLRPPVQGGPDIPPPVLANSRGPGSISRSTARRPPTAGPPQQNPNSSQRMMPPSSSRSAIGGSSDPPSTSAIEPRARITAENTSRAATLPAAPSRGRGSINQSKASDEKFFFEEVAPGAGLYEVSRDTIFEAIREIEKIRYIDGYIHTSIKDNNVRELVSLLKNVALQRTVEVIFRPVEWSDDRQSFEPVLLFRLEPPKPVDVWVSKRPKTEKEGRVKARIQITIFGCFVGIFKAGQNSATRLDLHVQLFDVNRRDGRYPESLMGWECEAKPTVSAKWKGGPTAPIRLFPLIRALFGLIPHVNAIASRGLEKALEQGDEDCTVARFERPVDAANEMDCRHYMAKWFSVFLRYELLSRSCKNLTFWAPTPADNEKMQGQFSEGLKPEAIEDPPKPPNGKDFGGLILFKPRCRIEQNRPPEYSYHLSRGIPKMTYGEERLASLGATQLRQDQAQTQEQEEAREQEQAQARQAQTRQQTQHSQQTQQPRQRHQAQEEPRQQPEQQHHQLHHQQPRQQPQQQQQQQHRQRQPQLTGASQGYETPMARPAARQPHTPPSQLGSAPAQPPYGRGQPAPQLTISNPIKDVYDRGVATHAQAQTGDFTPQPGPPMPRFTARDLVEINDEMARADHATKQHPPPTFTTEDTLHIGEFYHKIGPQVEQIRRATGPAPSLLAPNPTGQFTPAQNPGFVNPSSYGGQGFGTTPMPYGSGSLANVPQPTYGGFDSSGGHGSSHAGPSALLGQNTFSGFCLQPPSSFQGPGQRHAQDEAPSIFDDADYDEYSLGNTGGRSRNRDEDIDD